MQFYTFMLLYIKEIECECYLLWMQLALFSLQKLLFEVINKLWYVVLINIYLLSVSSPWKLVGDSWLCGLFQGRTGGTISIFTGSRCQQGHAWLSDVEQHLPKEILVASHTFLFFQQCISNCWYQLLHAAGLCAFNSFPSKQMFN